jgi:hypothetical protein
MAWQTKTIFGDGAKGHHRFTLNITEDSTSVITNKSYVDYSFVLSPVANGYNWEYNSQVPVTYWVRINGVICAEGNIMNYDGRSTVVVASGGLYIDHEANGYKDITFEFSVWSMDAYYLPGSASANGAMTLTPIPRQATITYAPNFTDEENPTITYSNPAGEAVSALRACIVYYDTNDVERRIVDYEDIPQTGTSHTFKLTSHHKSIIYAAASTQKSLRVVFYVTTWIGDNAYYSTLQRSVDIVNANPVISLATAVDIGDGSYSVTKNHEVMLKGFNYMQCTLHATSQKGAWIVSRYVACNGERVDITDTYGIHANVESNKFIFVVVDSRGNSTSETVTKEMIEYIKPSCSLDVDMMITEGSSAKAVVTVSGNWYAGTWGDSNPVKNNLTVEYQYKVGTGSYGKWTPIFSGNTQDTPYSVVIEIPNLNDQTTYTFQARTSDDIFDEVLSGEESVRATPVFDWGYDDFNFNVPVTIQGNRIISDPVSRIARAYTQELDIFYDAGSYIKLFRSGSPTDLYNQDIATFNDNGTITINKDMIALVNIHIVSHNNNGSSRSWIKLMNYDVDWQYTACILYGEWTTSQISTVLKFTANTTIGVHTGEDITINSGGPAGSYIEIIEL